MIDATFKSFNFGQCDEGNLPSHTLHVLKKYLSVYIVELELSTPPIPPLHWGQIHFSIYNVNKWSAWVWWQWTKFALLWQILNSCFEWVLLVLCNFAKDACKASPHFAPKAHYAAKSLYALSTFNNGWVVWNENRAKKNLESSRVLKCHH